MADQLMLKAQPGVPAKLLVNGKAEIGADRTTDQQDSARFSDVAKKILVRPLLTVNGHEASSTVVPGIPAERPGHASLST